MKSKAAWVAGLALLVAAFFYLSLAPNTVSCDVCVEFGGRTECRKASGKDREEAERTASGTACSALASGIESTIACQNTPPAKSSCAER